jgi:soluble lytic murein transglycosylase
LKSNKKRNWAGLLGIVILIVLGVAVSFPKWITFIYPLPHSEIVFAAAKEYKVDPYLVFAIIRAESKFETTAESSVGARGLMQIMPETAQWIAIQMDAENFTADDLHQPAVNIRMGCWYISDLEVEFKGNIPLEVAAYNAGRGKVSQWIKEGQWEGDPVNMAGIPFAETRQYVKNVLNNYAAYKAIYDSGK